MARFTSYPNKSKPADSDTLLINDASASANKQILLSGLFAWLKDKFTSTPINGFETTNQTIVGAINELHDAVEEGGSASEIEQIRSDVDDLKADLDDVNESLGDLDDRVDALENGGDGLTAGIKSALLALFQHVAYVDDDGQDYYDNLYDAFYPSARVVSISAVYTQTGTVYDSDTLDSLKADLVVTALMDDNTSQTVTTYTLSGTLTEGTSTITVGYSGKTTTFTVTVTHTDTSVVYNLPSTTVFDGSTTVVNTGVSPFSSDSDFTIVATFKANVTQNQFCGVWAAGDGTKMYMLRPTGASTGVWASYGGGKTSAYIGGNITITSDNDVVRYVYRHQAGNKFEIFGSVNGTTVVNGTEIGTTTMPTTAIEVRLGKSYANNTFFTGTIYDFKIYNRALTSNEITAYLAA